MTTTPREVIRIPERLRPRAASLLLAQGHGRGDDVAGRLMIEAAERHGVDTSRLWGVVGASGDPRAACLIVPGAGRTAVVFSSSVGSDDEVGKEDLAAVIDRACRELRGPGLAQALLDVEDGGGVQALERAGFRSVGRLEYLRRDWATPGGSPVDLCGPWPGGATVELASRAGDGVLAEALERSYEGTLDCPELCGLRSMADVIASHRATGQHDPMLWWLVRSAGEPAGALLLNPCPAQGHTELTYLGLCPALRGLGLAGALLRFGLQRLARRRERVVTCAVDARNVPARRLYEREGFCATTARLAFVRPLEGDFPVGA